MRRSFTGWIRRLDEAVSGTRPYLTATRFFLHHGFELVESTATGFDLVCFRPSEAAVLPRFADNARRGTVPRDEGVHFEFVYQCPFVPGCVREMSEVARGLVRYGAREIRKIQGKKTSEVAAILGRKEVEEVIHRDDMVVL